MLIIFVFPRYNVHVCAPFDSLEAIVDLILHNITCISYLWLCKIVKHSITDDVEESPTPYKSSM